MDSKNLSTENNLDIGDFIPKNQLDTNTNSIKIASVSSDGRLGNDISLNPSVSSDGRFVAFESRAKNLINDSQAEPIFSSKFNVLLHDNQTGQTTPIDIGLDGKQIGESRFPSISGDGKFIAFYSDAKNLVSDNSNLPGIFVRDIEKGLTTRISIDTKGNPGSNIGFMPKISGNGQYVAFSSTARLTSDDTNDSEDIYIRDIKEGETTRLNLDSLNFPQQRNFLSFSISDDAKFVTYAVNDKDFKSSQEDIIFDVYVTDRSNGKTKLVTSGINGDTSLAFSSANRANDTSRSPKISGDGRYITYESAASNLVPGDNNKANDVFLYDSSTGTTKLISIDADGKQLTKQSSEPSISSDGRYVSFSSLTDDRFIRFPDTQVFKYDINQGTSSLITKDIAGAFGNGSSISSFIAADGQTLAFASTASNLGVQDDNGLFDIYFMALQNGSMN
jgi:WD40-like Beta Propeller Repeat